MHDPYYHFHVHVFNATYSEPFFLNSVYLNGLETFLASVFLWSLMGLWLYLNERDRGKPGWIMTLFCGPSAWLIAAWHLTHKPAKLSIVPMPSAWEPCGRDS